MNRSRVLIVEDEALIAQSIANRVQQLGYQVSAIIRSGEEAIRSAVEMRPDIVLMDIQLGRGINGIKAATQIQEQCNIPVVYLTAYADETILQQAKITTPFGYIIKPFRDQDLHSSIEIALYRHKQDQKLRKSEERYRSLFDGVPVGLYRTAPTGLILDVNLSMVQMMGYPDREALLTVDVIDLYADIEDREQFRDLIERKGSVHGFQTQARRRDGMIISVEINAQSVRDADGQILYYEGSVADISARKQATDELHQALIVSQERETEISALLDSARAILKEREFEDAAHAIFDACKRTTGATAGYIALLSQDGEENEVLFLDSGGLPCTVDPYLPMPIRGLRAEAYHQGQVVYDNNFSASEWMRYMPEGHANLKNVMFAPLIIDQKTVGLLGLANKPGGFTENDARMAMAFGELAAIALRNSQTRKALHKEKDFAESLVETAQTIVLMLDTEGRIVSFNSYLEEISGYRLEDVQGQDWFSIFLPQRDHERTRKLFSQAVGDIQTQGNVNVIVAKDGREHKIEWYDKTLKDANGNVIGLVAVGQDITERIRAEKALRESEARYRALVDVSPNSIMLLRDGHFVFANLAGATILGFSDPEKILGMSALETVSPGSRELVAQRIENVTRGERNPPAEIELIKSDGSTISVESTSIPITLEGKSATMIIGQDITERKQTEEERDRLLAQIQEQARRVQQIIDTVPEGVLLLDTAGRIVLVNPTGEKDLVHLADAKVGDTLTHLGDHLLAKLLTSPPKGFWHEVTMGNRNFQIIARPLEAQSESRGWVLVIRDVTQQREFEKRAHQQDRLAAVGQLAAGIAHDFNNIIAVIALYARMLLRDSALPADMVERMEIIDQQAWRASDLIQQILDFSRHTELERTPIDLLMLLKEQVKLLERTLPENIKINLAYRMSECIVSADPTRIQQAIMNLATNARDAMPTGGHLHINLQQIEINPGESPPLPEMGTSQAMASKWLQLNVTDTGSGIPPNVLPHIFDPFFTTKPPDRGTGLGLAQVHGIIRSHEGHIDVQTQEGEGCTFIIYLPILTTRPDTKVPKQEQLVRGQGQTILVVEDADATRRAVVDSLKMLGYQILEATNGQEALALFEQRADDIAMVLSDVVMPEMGGEALFWALREHDPTIKVILMTGHPIEKELGELQVEGLNGWLLKPPVIEQLAQTIARVLEKE
ncbi:MAG: PAS domain S-box protein [Chloroflexi bacterium]|nr:PAS domain S-box protein [Chloroflexota bacterium]